MKSLCLKYKVKLLLLLFGLVLGPTLVLMLSSLHQVISRVNRAINISDQIVEQSRQLYHLTNEIETRWQRYIITGRDTDLEPYNQANQVFDQTLNQLRTTMQASPQALRSLEVIEHLRYKWLGIAADPVLQARKHLTSTQEYQQTIQRTLQQEIRDKSTLQLKTLAYQFPEDMEPEERIFILEIIRAAAGSIAAQRGAILTGAQHHINAFYQTYAEIKNQAEQSASCLQTPKVRQKFQEFMELYNHWCATIAMPQIKAQIHYNKDPMSLEDAIAVAIKGLDQEVLQELKNEINHFTEFLMEDMHNHLSQSKTQANRMSQIRLILGLSGYLLILIFLVLLERSILKPIDILGRGIQRIREGDVSHRIDLTGSDEYSSLAQTFNDMTAELQEKTLHLIDVNQTLSVTNKELFQHQRELENTNQKLATEIKEHKQAQDILASTIDQLENANRDLEEFAFVASHDLKTPIRGIGSLANILLKDYADAMDDEGRHFLQLLSQRAKRTYDQVGGILEFSHLLKSHHKKERVNIQSLLPEIISELSPPPEIQIHLPENLPELVCDPWQIQQVFTHLLDNAIRFLEQPQGNILVQCTETPEDWIFSVTDNGPGIEERYHQKIFGFFQTLACKDELETTGMGLALIRKIVQINEGKVWLESNPGHGSTFYVSLPKRIVDPAYCMSSPTPEH